MAATSTDQYAAGEQGLGYIYQPRFALLRLMQLPEDTSVLIEKDDDLDFIDQNGVKSLASLKHKGTRAGRPGHDDQPVAGVDQHTTQLQRKPERIQIVRDLL